MSNDFSPINTPETESPMFAGVPSWERGKKARNFGSRGSRAAAEPRSFAPDEAPIATRPIRMGSDARPARMDTVDPTDTTFASGATFADRRTRKGNGAGPIMVVAGIILVGGLAAGGWYAMQPHNTGVAELTPGSRATTTTATTPGDTTTATSAPVQVAQNTTPAPAPAPARSTTTTTTTHAAKPAASRTTVTRAPPARSAADVGANASTTAAPAPAPAAPPAAAAPAPLVLTLPPQAAPATTAPAATAPLTTAPAEAPLPTQTAPAPAPTQTPPN